MRIDFLVPGDLATPTGGYRYDARLIDGLRARGHTVTPIALSPRFPQPDERALVHLRQVLAGLPDDAVVLVDGLAFGAIPDAARAHAARLRLVALVHHPLAMETGLAPRLAARLARSEREALACARAVIVTSTATAQALADYDVPAARIRVAEPGIEDWPAATRSRDGAVAMLYVASVVPRKGHALLLEALAQVAARTPQRWHLTCAGALDRDAATARAVQARAGQPPLAGRVTFTGAVDDTRLSALYGAADVFVCASHFEGYGMAAAQALACGLPVITTRGGALAQTVPAAASLQVPPGDASALADAIVRYLEDPGLQGDLAAGVRAAAPALPRWPATVDRVEAALAEVARG